MLSGKPKAVWIDDQPRRITSSNAHGSLSRDYEIVIFTRACEALTGWQEICPKFMVVDMRMPTPEGVSPSRTSDGNTTGLWLLEQCGTLLKQKRIPVAIVTFFGVNDPEAIVKERIPHLEGQCVCYDKDHFLDDEEVLQRFLSHYVAGYHRNSLR